jgi:adenylate kinase
VRDEIRKEGSAYGREFQQYVNQGKLIPDELINNMAINKLKQMERSVILDGYPRNLEQAALLDREIGSMGQRKVVAVNIALDREVTIEKLLGRVICKTCKDEFNTANIDRNGYVMPALMPDPKKCKLGPDKCNFVEERRPDDNLETITKRFDEFERKTAPLIKYYGDKSALKTFHVKKGVRDAPDLIKLLLE